MTISPPMLVRSLWVTDCGLRFWAAELDSPAASASVTVAECLPGSTWGEGGVRSTDAVRLIVHGVASEQPTGEGQPPLDDAALPDRCIQLHEVGQGGLLSAQ